MTSSLLQLCNNAHIVRTSSLLRHCATSRKVAGSIPDGVIGIFHWLNPSGRTLVLGSNQPLTEMSKEMGKDGRCVGLTTLPPSCADCHGTLRTVEACTWITNTHIAKFTHYPRFSSLRPSGLELQLAWQVRHFVHGSAEPGVSSLLFAKSRYATRGHIRQLYTTD